MKKIAIIGGGASGISASIEAKRTAAAHGADIDVTIFEGLPRICKKILVTGNGRCNLSNINISQNSYRGNSELAASVLGSKFADTAAFFSSVGLLLREESGRLYPRSENAGSVADALRFASSALGCNIITDTHIDSISCKGNGFVLNGTICADAVIMACGGASSPSLGSDGSGYKLLRSLQHSVTQTRPALVSVRCADTYFKSLKGIRAKGTASLIQNGRLVYKEAGEIQFTDYGLSGIPIFNLSGLIEEKSKNTVISLDLCPEMSSEELLAFIKGFIEKDEKPTLADCLSGIIPKRLGEIVLKRSDIPISCIPKDAQSGDIIKIADTIKGFTATVSNTGGFANAQVTAGGVATEEIDINTLSSRIIKALYICGELLDADGICGGYNLHFAWTTGRIAGYNAVTGIIEND